MKRDILRLAVWPVCVESEGNSAPSGSIRINWIKLISLMLFMHFLFAVLQKREKSHKNESGISLKDFKRSKRILNDLKDAKRLIKEKQYLFHRFK